MPFYKGVEIGAWGGGLVILWILAFPDDKAYLNRVYSLSKVFAPNGANPF